MNKQGLKFIIFLIVLMAVIVGLSRWHQQRHNPYDADAFFGQAEGLPGERVRTDFAG